MIDAILPAAPRYDIVLVNLPSQPDEAPAGYRRSVPPLGLGSIATYLAQRGIAVGLLDADDLGLSVEAALDILSQQTVDYIGLNCYSAGVSICQAFLDALDGHGKGRLVGGPHVSAVPDAFSNFRDTVSVVGFGERLTYEIVSGQRPFESGIASDVAMRPEITNVVVDQAFFRNRTVVVDGLREGVITTSRGCPYRCAFCMSAKGGYAYAAMTTVMEGIEQLVRKHGAQSIHLLDDVALPSNKRLAEFCAYASDRELLGAFTWRGLFSIPVLRRLNIDLLTAAGCRGISIGVESGSKRMLSLLGKRFPVDEVLSTLDLLDRTPIEVKLFFMVGLPTETDDCLEATRTLIRQCAGHGCVRDINVFQYKPYPGTPLFEQFFRGEHVEYFYEDLRIKFPGRIVCDAMGRALAKDTYFCRHRLLAQPVERLQDWMVDLYREFYSNKQKGVATR